MAHRALLRATLLLAATVAAACASSSAAGRRDAACTSDLARDPRSLNEVLDSAALANALTAAWHPAAGTTLATIAFDSAGSVDSTTVVSAAATLDTRRRVVSMINSAVHTDGDPREPVRLFIGDDAGLALHRVERFGGCAPRLLNRPAIVRAMENEGTSLMLLNPTTVQIYARVDTDGRVSEVEVNRSSSNLNVDAAAVRVMRTATFEPALIEGIPVGTWVAFPVTFQVAERPDGPDR